MNLWKKRIVANLLAVTMIISSLQFSAYDVYAQEIADGISEVENTLENEDGVSAVDAPEDEDETVSENSETTDFDIIAEKAELDGIYQFGGAPSRAALEIAEPSLSVESETSVDEVNGLTVEEYIYQEMLNRNKVIDISAYNIAYNGVAFINSLVYGVINENPDLYFVKPIQYWSNGTIYTKIDVEYDDSFDDNAFKNETKAALSLVNNSMSDLQKAIILHDYLTVNCEYDYENYLNGTIPAMSYTAYGVLVNRAAVCQGYALTYKYLLNQVGIVCYMVDSDKMNHAWNLIKLDGEFYQVDVTWDDPTWDLIGRARHTYMFLSDETFTTAGSGHHDWKVTSGGEVVDYKAVDTRYEEAFWKDVKTPLVLTGDNWNDCYYAYYDSNVKKGRINKAALSDIDDAGTAICDIGQWLAWNDSGWWQGAYTGLFKYNNRLYFNDISSIYSINFDGTDKRTEFTADTTNGYIYGSALCKGKVLYTMLQTPNYDGKTTVLEADIEIHEEQPVIPVESIVLNIDALTLSVGSTAQLKATVTPENATNAEITWSSSDSLVAEVEDGTVTAVSEGTCEIKAKAGDKEATCSVTVEENSGEPTIIPVTGIALRPTELTLKVGETSGLEATVTPENATDPAITWSSSNPSVAKVENGTVTAVSVGICEITAKAGEKEATCSVTVEENGGEPTIIPVTGIALSPTELTLKVGETSGLEATVTPENATDPAITWSSSNPLVAKVEDGTVAAVSAGSCTITAKAGEKEAVCNVTVEKTNGNKEGIKVELKDTNNANIYIGTAITPAIVVTNNGEPLTEGVDYTVKYSNNVKASTSAKITVTGKGNLTKSYTKTFTIEAKRLDDEDIDPSDETAPRVLGDCVTVVEGSKVSPSLLYNGTKLTAKDFKLPDEYKSYNWKLEDNTANDGSYKTMTVTASENGNFKGTKEITVKVIAKAEQKNCKLAVSISKDVKKLTYDGEAKDIKSLGLLTISTKNTPATELKEAKDGQDGDYIISYPNDITSAGTKKFTVTGISDRCTGTVTKTFTIKPKKTEFNVTYDEDNSGYAFVSTGTKVDDLVVKDGADELTEGKDYKVTYSGNKKVGTNAKFTVTGLGSYKGSKCTKTFMINNAVLNNNPASTTGKTAGLEIAVADKVFKKAGVYKSSPYVSINGVLLKASDYTVTYYLDNPVTNTDPRVMDSKNKLANGDATVWVKIVGKGNYAVKDDTCFATASYRVRSLASSDSYDLSKAKITFRDKSGKAIKKIEYTGEPINGDDITVVVTYKIGNRTVMLNEGEHYTVEYVNNVNKGNATIVINGSPNQNSYVGSKTATFSIVASNLQKLTQ